MSRDRRTRKAAGTETKGALVIDGETGTADPTSPVTAANTPLSSALDVRREMAILYREAKGKKRLPEEAGKLVWMLSQIGKMIEIHEIEQRVAELEERLGEGRRLPDGSRAPAQTH